MVLATLLRLPLTLKPTRPRRYQELRTKIGKAVLISYPYSTQNHPFSIMPCAQKPTETHQNPPILTDTYRLLTGMGVRKKGKDRGGATHPRKKQRKNKEKKHS
jgi:hypothetical protein